MEWSLQIVVPEVVLMETVSVNSTTQSRAELRARARPPSEAHLRVADGTATGLAGPEGRRPRPHRNRLPSRQEPPGPSNDHRVKRDPILERYVRDLTEFLATS